AGTDSGSVRRDRGHGPAYRPRTRDLGRVLLRDQPVRPGDAGLSSDRLGDQAVCLYRGVPARLYAIEPAHGRAGSDRPGAGPAEMDAEQLHPQILRAADVTGWR